jgi:hypothetical protein
VATGAHKKALGLTAPPSGIRSFSWDGWKVSGDPRGSHDTYVAAKRLAVRALALLARDRACHDRRDPGLAARVGVEGRRRVGRDQRLDPAR